MDNEICLTVKEVGEELMPNYKLRPYQQQTVDLIIKNIKKKVSSQLIESPTGSGKTFIAANVIKKLNEMGLTTFFVVANQPLVKQTYDEFEKFELSKSIIKSGMEKYYNSYAKNQIVMLQSYFARVNKLPDLKPDVLIFDECDFCSKGSMVAKIKEKNSDALIVGLTGTPTNHAGYLLKGFEFYHRVVSIKQLQEEGFLSIDKNYVPLSPDLKNVRVMSTGDFNEVDLDEACNQNYIIDDIVNSYKKVDCGYKGIVFAINIKHAEKLRDAFLEADIRCGIVSSKQKKFQNQYWLDAHKSGRIQLLINIGMLTRGFNSVDLIDCIFARPTASLPLYIQCVGRMARLDHEGKNFFRLFDYGGNVERFGLWSESRLYSHDKEPKKEIEFSPVVCPNCFSVIYEKTNKCPECEFILKAQMEKREREIVENQRVQEVVEIKALTGSSGAIEACSKLLGKNGNTFYYTKLLSMKPASLDTDTFNSEVIRLANYARRSRYNPFYVVHKLKEKVGR
jgi:superfamily II DNA or RNA helicase